MALSLPQSTHPWLCVDPAPSSKRRVRVCFEDKSQELAPRFEGLDLYGRLPELGKDPLNFPDERLTASVHLTAI